MLTEIINLNSGIYRIVTTDDMKDSIPIESITKPYTWDDKSVIILNGKMVPNIPELIKLWDDQIQYYLNTKDLNKAWEIFLTKPNKEDYSRLVSVEFYHKKHNYNFMEYFRSQYDYGYWGIRETVKLDHFIDYMNSLNQDLVNWKQGEEFIETDLYLKNEHFVRDRYYFKSREDFCRKLKLALINANFGSMYNDW